MSKIRSCSHNPILPALAIFSAVITFLIYIPSLSNDFVTWDDQLYITENPMIKHLDFAFIKWVFTHAAVSNWHPLTMISHAVDYAIWGMNPMGHHLTGIIFHALDTMLVFILALKLSEIAIKKAGSTLNPFIIGVIAALLFGLHPLHVESVTWISERKDVLSAFFFILSILAYLKYNEGQKKALFYVLTLFSFVLALMSKPMAISLPFVLLIIDFYPLERLTLNNIIKALVEKIPFFILSQVSALLTIWAQKSALSPIDSYPLIKRIAVAVRAYAFYLYKTFIPIDLAPFYPMPEPGNFFNSIFIISLIFIVSLTILALLFIKKKRIFFAVWAYFIITLVPVIGIVQVGSQAAADRYMYLPSLGIFILVGVAIANIARAMKKPVAATVAISLAIILVLSLFTGRQEAVWTDSITLWSHELNLFPERIPLVYNNRGLGFKKAERYQEAIADFTKAIELNRAYMSPYFNRAFTYQKIGNIQQAIEDYNLALALDPKFAKSYMQRGVAYGSLGDFNQALSDFNKALELDPEDGYSYLNRGVVFLELGEYQQSIEDFKKAVIINPDKAATAYYGLGKVYARVGDTGNAVVNLRKASAMGFKDADNFMEQQGWSQ